MRGNIMDLAVGIIIGAAFNQIISAVNKLVAKITWALAVQISRSAT